MCYSDAELQFDSSSIGTRTLDILVENWGRVNFGLESAFDQRKGLHEGTKVLLDNTEVSNWEIISLQFNSNLIKR